MEAPPRRRPNDLAFVLQCVAIFSPRDDHNITSPSCYGQVFHSWHPLSKWWRPTRDFTGLIFVPCEIICASSVPKLEDNKEKVRFFYSKESTFEWDPYWWRWVECYNLKFGRDPIINTQECLPCNNKFYWSQVWDPSCSRNEDAFLINENIIIDECWYYSLFVHASISSCFMSSFSWNVVEIVEAT